MKKTFFLGSAVLAILLSGVAVALAQEDDYGLGKTAGAAGIDTTADVPTLAGNVIGTALSIIGVLFFILMIYGGLLWMTARGNEEQTKKASNTITAAVIGMVIILASYAITNFVFQAVGGGGETCESEAPGYRCVDDVALCDSSEQLADSSPPICSTGRVCCQPQ